MQEKKCFSMKIKIDFFLGNNKEKRKKNKYFICRFHQQNKQNKNIFHTHSQTNYSLEFERISHAGQSLE